MGDDCPKQFTRIPCSTRHNKWTMTVQSSSLIFLVQDGLQMGDDCSKKYTHIPCSRQITNGQWLLKAVLLYSAFEQNYNGAVTCPKYPSHIHLTVTFKKFDSSSTEVKTPNETGRQGRVGSLCVFTWLLV